MLTKAELEFYESARHSLASMSQSLGIITKSCADSRARLIIYRKYAEIKKQYDSWIGTGAMETEDQAMWLGKIKVLEELIKEIEDGTE